MNLTSLFAWKHLNAVEPSPIAIRAGACTRKGSARRNNEDGNFIDTDGHIFLVADGVGGSSAGEKASRMAVDLLPRLLANIAEDIEMSDEEVFEALRAAFAETNAEIVAEGHDNTRLHKMGTTAVLGLVHVNRLFVASVGDSRAYLIRRNRLQQLTRDHTMAQALVDAGTISAEEASQHKWRNILSKSLGNQDSECLPDVRALDLQDGDRIVLATDGLTDVIDDQSISSIVRETANAQLAADTLIEEAEQNDGPDDATCVVLFVGDVDEPSPTHWWHHAGGRFGPSSH